MPIRSLLQVRLQSGIPNKSCIPFPDNLCGFGVSLCALGLSKLGCYTLQFRDNLNSSHTAEETVLLEEVNVCFLDMALKV